LRRLLGVSGEGGNHEMGDERSGVCTITWIFRGEEVGIGIG
jgi:hypothetical protein